MYNVNWANIINWMMPPFLRTNFHLNFINALLLPFKSQSLNFQAYVSDVNYRLSHGSQVCHLTGALNDQFDNANRGIYITDGGGLQVTLIDDDSEYSPREPLYAYPDDDIEPSLMAWPDSAYTGSPVDFIVNVPASAGVTVAPYNSKYYEMKALVEYYKLAGKMFTIEII